MDGNWETNHLAVEDNDSDSGVDNRVAMAAAEFESNESVVEDC